MLVFLIADSNPYTYIRRHQYITLASRLCVVLLAVRDVEGLVVQTASCAVLAKAVQSGRKRSVSVAHELNLVSLTVLLQRQETVSTNKFENGKRVQVLVRTAP